MSRRSSRHRPEWQALEGRFCPSLTGAAAHVVPVERLDSYAVGRHDQILADVAAGRDGIVFLGDSITDFFGRATGSSVWINRIAPLGGADFGVAGDTAENLLWRIENGELAGHPKLAVVNIGTNDLGYGSSVDDTITALQAVVEEIQTISPGTQILLMGLFPRGASATDPLRLEINAVNAALQQWAPTVGVGFVNIDPELTSADGTLVSADFFADNIHPNASGYEVWADAIEGLLVDVSVSGSPPWNTATTSAPPSTTTTSANTTAVASDGGVAGVTHDSNVWYYQADNDGAGRGSWSALNAPGNVVAVVSSTSPAGAPSSSPSSSTARSGSMTILRARGATPEGTSSGAR